MVGQRIGHAAESHVHIPIRNRQTGTLQLLDWLQARIGNEYRSTVKFTPCGDIQSVETMGKVRRVLFRCLAEAAALIAVLAVADRARRTHSVAELMSGSFAGTLAVLAAVASISVLVLIRTQKRRRTHALINTLMLLFGVIALGVSTLTWAQSARGDDCGAATCACQRR